MFQFSFLLSTTGKKICFEKQLAVNVACGARLSGGPLPPSFGLVIIVENGYQLCSATALEGCFTFSAL